jgi:hypothetical protein
MKHYRLLILALMIVIVCNIYQFINYKTEKNSLVASIDHIKNDLQISNKIFGKNIVRISLEPYFIKNNGFDKAIIIYANLTGCGKCIDHHLNLASKLTDQNNLRYVFYAYTKAQITQVVDKYKIGKNVFWDKNDEFAKYINEDTRKINPFILLVYNDKAFMLKFSYENDFNYLNHANEILQRE